VEFRHQRRLRPTFGDSTQLTIETFLLDPLAGETPRRISVEFLWRVREERKFTNPEALKARILRDAAAARRYLRVLGRCSRVRSRRNRVACFRSLSARRPFHRPD